MPARHDILCGALDFLWKPWGSIEVWEQSITALLRTAGVVTMLASDHPHLFETGGENYHTDFSAWDYVRGHEGDPWRTYPDLTGYGAPVLPAWAEPWTDEAVRHVAHVLPRRRGLSRTRTMAAAEWLVAGAAPREVAALRRRVRSPRALRHAGAVGRPLRPRLGRRARHLAAVRRARVDRGTARGP